MGERKDHMSDTTVLAAEGQPIAIDPASNAQNPPPPAAKPAAKAGEEPDWLLPRLERERNKVLKDLGVTNLDDAKKAIELAKAAEDAKKSDAEKKAQAEAALSAAQGRVQEMAEALGALAQGQMNALTDAQKNAVLAVAGDDPAKQIKTIEALRPTWASAAAPAAPAVAQAPKDTAPAPAAPKDGDVAPPPDAKTIHSELKKTNPILAARYAMANGLFDH